MSPAFRQPNSHMSLAQSHVVHLAIDSPFERVVDFLSDAGNFPKWAAVQGEMTRLSELEWEAQTEFGERIVRFSPRNEFGVFDHAVYKPGDRPIRMPLQIIQNEDGCDLVFLFPRRPGVTDEQFASSVEWVTSDFMSLRSLLEAPAGRQRLPSGPQTSGLNDVACRPNRQSKSGP
jgi:hypothetical protein